MGHQAPCPGGVEEGGRVVDLDAGVGGEVRHQLCDSLSGKRQERGGLEAHGVFGVNVTSSVNVEEDQRRESKQQGDQ